MIPFEEVERIHARLIAEFGGSHGIREPEALRSALARPFQAFDNKDLYPTPIHKAASLIESILINHPFIDGNKRTGYVLMRILLLTNELDIYATQQDKYDFVIGIASGQLKFDSIYDWLTRHTVKK
jgi:death on curing protein